MDGEGPSPWLMPEESAHHERTWMAFPTEGYTLGESAEDADQARRTWAEVANAIAEFEPVVMVVNPGDEKLARRLLTASIALETVPLNDAWMRDMGPTFVRNANEPDTLGAVCWTFNGWGAQDWARWDKDASVGAVVAELSGARIVESDMVNEGGGIHVDGRGAVLLTETVQLDPGRNPGYTHLDVEAEIARTIGATDAIWLPRGLTRDSERFGTRGHVDIVATFTHDGRVLYHNQTDPGHPDFAVSRHIFEVLSDARTEDGAIVDVVPMPAPTTLRDDEGWVDYSYINHLVVNDGVIACGFDDPMDEVAAEILRSEFPGRDVVTVDARPLFARGGGIHCITQHQPSVALG